jgi:ribosomal subunit interface protein
MEKIMVKAYDFDVTITCRHNDCDQKLKDSIIHEMLKLSRYHTHIIDGSVVIDKKNSSIKVEVSVRVPGLTITAANEDFNQAKALDTAVEKVKRQLKKLKSKVVDHRIPPQQHPILELGNIKETDATEQS